jgi:hypothetical protein
MNFNKIYEYDFEVNYYKFIELIFNNQNFRNKTYNFIDDLIESLKLGWGKKFLIMGANRQYVYVFIFYIIYCYF